MIDVVPDGQTPQTVTLCLYEDLVDVAKPGDRYVNHVNSKMIIHLSLTTFSD